MKKIVDIGLLELTERLGFKGVTFRQFISELTGLPINNLESSLAYYLGIDKCLEFLIGQEPTLRANSPRHIG